MAEKSSYYKDSIPRLIEQYKLAAEQCLNIVGQEIDDELSDDKLHNVLKAKRMAGEDAKYYAEQIDTLENERNGIDTTEEEKVKQPVNMAKKYAKKPG